MIGLIFAQSSNGFIGKDGKLLFSIPEDIQRFKSITEGSTVIMGRKTWESLPPKFRPLPNRNNIVLTRRDPAEEISSGKVNYNGAWIANSLTDALHYPNLTDRNDWGDFWIVGGESVYNEGMKYADVIEQTLVTKEFEGDARAPYIDPTVWKSEVGKHFKEHNGLYYQFNTFRRIKP